MGRFYKTAKPEMIDFMFKVPEQAIMTAVKGADAQLDTQHQYVTDLQKQLNVAALEPDKEKRDVRVKELEGKIKEHTLKLWENPLLALKEGQQLRQLGQEIHEDLTRGELFAYQSNYATRQKFYDEAIKRATDKEGKVRMQDVDDAMKAFDAQYVAGKGAMYRKEGNKFNPYGTENLVDYFDDLKFAQDTAAKMKTHKSEEWRTTSDGQHFWKTFESHDVLGLDEMTAAVYSNMLNNDNLKDYYDQRIKFEAMNKARELSKSLGIPFEEALKQTHQELRDDYYGKRDPETGQLLMREVLDEKGEPVYVDAVDSKGNKIKKKRLEPVNEGKLLKTARDASDLYDINDYKKGTDLAGTNQFSLERLKQQHRKDMEDYKKKLTEPIVIDNNNGLATKQILPGKNLAETKTALNDQKQKIEKFTVQYKAGLLESIAKNKNLSPAQFQAVKANIENFLKSDNPDWNGLKNYLASGDLRGLTDAQGNPIATGVDAIRKQYENDKTQYNNQMNIFSSLTKAAEEKLIKEGKLTDRHSQQYISGIKANVEAKKRELQGVQELLEKVKKGDADVSHLSLINLQAEAVKLKTDAMGLENVANELEKEKNAYMNAELNMDYGSNMDVPSANRTNMKIYSIGGDIFENLGAKSEDVTRFKNVLTNMQKGGLWRDVLQGTNAKLIGADGRPVDFNTDAFIGTLFNANDVLSRTTDNEGNLVIKTKNGEFKYETQSVRISRDDVSGMGPYAWQYTVLGTDPQTKQRRPYTIYVPYREGLSNDVDKLIKTYDADLQYDMFINEAQANTVTARGYGQSVDYETLGGKVAYNSNNNMVKFRMNDGTVKEMAADSEQAKFYFKEIYKAN